MNLSEALHGALGAYYSFRGRSDHQSMRAALERVTGSKKAASQAAGIGRSTWGFWDAGKREPSGANLRKLADAYEQYVARPARRQQRKVRPLPHLAAVTAVVVAFPQGTRYMNGKNAADPKSHRLFNAGKGKNLDLSDTVAAWVQGADPAGPFLQDVERAYGEPFGFEGDDVHVRLY